MRRQNWFIKIAMVCLLMTLASSFVFMEIVVSPNTTIINKVAFYTFYADRTMDSTGSITDYTTPVPAGSNITIRFPSMFNTSYGYTCSISNVNYPCTISGQNVVIQNYFTTAVALQNLNVTISNILNPSPALNTGAFVMIIGDDYSDTAYSNLASVQLQSDNFTACSITFSPSNVNRASSTMIVRATPQNTIPSTGYIVITLPSAGSWTGDISSLSFPLSSSMTCSNATSNVNQLVTCVGTSSTTRFITASSLFNSNTSAAFGIQVSNMPSPPMSVPKDQVIITSMQNGYPIDVCTTSVTGLQPNIMTVSISSGNSSAITVNRAAILKFTLTVVDNTNINDTYTIVFPTGSRITATPSIGGPSIQPTGVTLNSLTVAFSQQSSATSMRLISAGSLAYITMTNYVAPPSTQVTSPITVTILRDGSAKMVGYATIQAALSTLNFTVTPSSLTVNTNTSYLFNITISDGLLSSGRIKIDFPSTVSQSWTSSSCATLTGTNLTSSPTCALASGTSTLIISNLNLSSNAIGAQTFTLRVNGVTNPPSTQTSGSFNITTYYTTTDDTSVATGSMGAVTATVSTLNSSSVVITPSSYVVQANGVNYTVSFQNNNPIPTNGYITLGIPYGVTTQISSVTNMCFASTSSAATPSSTSCTGVDTGSMYMVTFPSIFSSSGVASNSTITLRINSIFTNPISTQPVSSFSISTYASGGFLIDQLASGLSVKMTTPADFTSVSVSAVSTVNSDITSYTINLAQPSALDSNSRLAVTFPAQIIPQSNVACTNLSSGSLSCSVSGQVVTVSLGSAAVNTGFGVIIANVKNSPSLKPSSKFGFSTITQSGLGQFSQNLSTVSVSTSKPSTFKSLTYSFSPQILLSPVSASIIFTPTSSISGSAVVSLASSFTIGTLSCVSVAFTGSCATGGSANKLNVTGSFTTESMTLTISGLTSPSAAPSDYTVFTTYDSSDYIIDQSTSSIQFALSCTLPCRTCSSDPTSCLSCYNSTITSSIYYNNITNKCVTTCDSGYYPDSTLLQCKACNVICGTCVNISTNCSSCNSTSGFPYLNKTTTSGTCLANCDSGMYPDTNQSPTLCVVCVSPCVTCTTQTACLSCITVRYLYLTSCVTTCPVNISIGNSTSNTCDPCASVCATCVDTPTKCVSCAPNVTLHNGSCVTSCPTGMVVKDGTCVNCDSPCQTCTGTSTNCTSCISTTTTPHLFNNTCATTCPSQYYNESLIGDCISCATAGINCAFCSSKTTCVTCDLGFVFLNSACLSTVPAGYVNISGYALPCTGDCGTCSVIQSNCTSCKTLFLSDYQCIATCPNYTAPISRVCTTCTSPCSTCSSLVTNCTSCLTTLSPAVYLSGNQCIATCPTYTYANQINYECTPCVSPCFDCSSLSICKSCATGFSLYLTSCLADCPSGFTSIASVCVACTSPCMTCSTSQTTCTSCLGGLSPQLFLTSTFCVIASQCPATTYANLTTNKCTDCIAPCSTCTNASACLSCITNYNLDGTLCKSSCLDGQVPINSVCTPCTSPCATCVTTTTQCLSCVQLSTSLFLSGYFCVSTCPSGTYANSSTYTCATCTSPCATCSSSMICLSCIASYFLYLGTCNTSCPIGYVGVISSCQPCATGCKTCQNTVNYCTACQANYYLMVSASECIQTCPTGLFADATSGTCIGCSSPCLTCSGSTSNCTSCTSGYVYQGTCVSTCPSATYLFNSQCQSCPTGCSSCTSATQCQSCLSAHYLYQNGCVSSCPGSAAVITNGACTACSTANCQTCNSGDFCLSCNSPYLISLGNCVTTCPTNFTSNGTNCIDLTQSNATQTLNNTLSSSKIFPLPFTIGAIVVIIVCLVAKFHGNTFASGAIYSLVGLLQWGALGVFGLLYYLQINGVFDLQFWVIAVAMGIIYILNFVTFILLLTVYKSDTRFKSWLSKTCSSRGSYSMGIILSLVMSHKYCNIMFTKLFNFNAFKAQLQNVQKFYSLHVVSFLSLFHSLIAIGVASYISYYNSTSLNQLFLSGIDVVVLSVVGMIMAGANAQKDDTFFMEKDGEFTLNKKIIDNDQYLGDGVDPDGVQSQVNQAFNTGKKGKYYPYNDPGINDSQNSINVMLEPGVDSESNQMIMADTQGEESVNPRIGMTPLSRQINSRLSKGSQNKNNLSKYKVDTRSRDNDESFAEVVQHVDVSIQALQILSQQGSRSNTPMDNIFDQNREKRPPHVEKDGKIDQSIQYASIDWNSQNINREQQKMMRINQQNMEYKPSMLSEISKKRSLENSRYDKSSGDERVQILNKSLANSQISQAKSDKNSKADPLLNNSRLSQKQNNGKNEKGNPLINYRSIEQSIPETQKSEVPNKKETIQSKDQSENAAQKQAKLEKILKQKEQELSKIRKEVNEKQKEGINRKETEKDRQEEKSRIQKERQSKLINEMDNPSFKKKGGDNTKPITFTRDADNQSPLNFSKTLERDKKMDNPLNKTNNDPNVSHMSGILRQKQEIALPLNNNRSKCPPPYENADNIGKNEGDSTFKAIHDQAISRQLPSNALDQSRSEDRIQLSHNEQMTPHNRNALKSSSSKTIEEMKQMLDQLKDSQSKKITEKLANNFTFNKDEVQVGSKLSEDDLQNMRSLKSELSNSKRIDIIEEARDQNQSEVQNGESNRHAKTQEKNEERIQNEARDNLRSRQPKTEGTEEQLLEESDDNSQNIAQIKDQSSQDLIKSNEMNAKTKKTKVEQHNKFGQTDGSRADQFGTAVLMKDILSEPQNNRLKFKHKKQFGGVEKDLEKEQDFDLSDDGSLSRGATEFNTAKVRLNDKQQKGRSEFGEKYQQDNDKYKFSIDNDDIEKSVRQSEDQLYKNPISLFPQTNKRLNSQNSDDLVPRGIRGRRATQNIIEEHSNLLTPQPYSFNKSKTKKIIPQENDFKDGGKKNSKEERNDSKQKRNSNSKEKRQFVGPIILKANGDGDLGDKRLSKPSFIKRSPLKDDLKKGDSKTVKNNPNPHRPEVLMSDTELDDSGYDPLDRTVQNRSNALTLQSRDQSDFVPNKNYKSPPKKFNLMYETSGVQGQSIEYGDVGLSPTDFNQFNQRYEDQKSSPQRPGGPRNDLPMKPQIITLKHAKDRDARSKPQLSPIDHDLHRRVPLMINTLGVQEPQKDQFERDRSNQRQRPMRTTVMGGLNQLVDEDLREFYKTKESRFKQMKVDRDLEKIYLQRQHFPKKTIQKPGRSTSRDKF